MALLTPKDLETVRRQQVKNILAKQAAGKTLTAREVRTLAEASSDVPPGQENFVQTQDELAQRLSVSRKTIQNVMRRRDDYPRPRADGRHDVEAWLRFFAENHIAGADAEGSPEDRPVTVADWKSRELELKCERLEIENAKMAGQLVAANDVETGLSALMSAARQAMNNIPGKLAQKVLHLADFHEAEEIIQREVDGVLRIFERCEFLDALRTPGEAQEAPVTRAAPAPEDAPPVKLTPKASALPPKAKPRGKKKVKAPAKPQPVKKRRSRK